MRTFEIVLPKKLTTKSADPSVEIARLRAALPVATVLIGFFLIKSHAITFPAALSVAYTRVPSGERTTALGLEPMGMRV